MAHRAFELGDNTVHDNALGLLIRNAASHPLGYVSEGEQHALKSYWEVPVDVLEDHGQLQQWAERAYRAAVKMG